MSILEKQAELGRTLYQINSDAMRAFFEFQRENVEKYLELNRSYADKLPETQGVSEFVALQKDYNETIWNGVKESVQTQAELLKGTLEETGEALKTAFTPAEEDDEVLEEVVKPKAKSSSTAKVVNNTAK